MKKKIFILTGEASGDKLADQILSNVNISNFEIKCIGGDLLKKRGLKLIFHNKEISYMGIVSVLFNFFKIYKKFNLTIKEIIKFNPDVILTVDSPDFSFRILEKIKKLLPNIQTFHYVSPAIWAWRSNRINQIKKIVNHIFLLFPFEKKIYDEVNIKNTFVGHPFFNKKIIYKKNNPLKNLITLCPGSRISEIRTFMPIFLDVIKNINKKYVFHIPTNNYLKKYITSFIYKTKNNFIFSTNEDEKNYYINKSIISLAKSGTISLDIVKNKCPLINVYKVNFLTYLIARPLVHVKFGNIINIMANKMIIPEFIQNNCTSEKIYNSLIKFLSNSKLRSIQLKKVEKYTKCLKVKNGSKIISNLVFR